MQKLLRFMSAYVIRLRIRVQENVLGTEARTLAIESLVKILELLCYTTRKMREGFVSKSLCDKVYRVDRLAYKCREISEGNFHQLWTRDVGGVSRSPDHCRRRR